MAAIVEGPEGFLCWVKPTGGPPEKRLIEIGDTNDEFSIVTAGLAEGEDVVLNPLAFVDEAQLQALEFNNSADSESASALVGEVTQEGRATNQRDRNSKTDSSDSHSPKQSRQQPESAGAQTTNLGATVIKQADKNGDGFLSLDEVRPEDQASFSTGDTNGDGKLSAAEIDAALAAAKKAADDQ